MSGRYFSYSAVIFLENFHRIPTKSYHLLSFFQIWILGVLFSMIANYQLMRQKLSPDGVMTFCRSIGRPTMEEFMFSYSWKRDPDVVRTLAKALSSAGVGVWIGSCLFWLTCSTVLLFNALFHFFFSSQTSSNCVLGTRFDPCCGPWCPRFNAWSYFCAKSMLPLPIAVLKYGRQFRLHRVSSFAVWTMSRP